MTETKITITEALAETKTIRKRIEKKQEFVLQNLYRQERIKDPLEKNGGSAKVLASERQAISDLEQRLVKIRTAISAANTANSITINGQTKTIEEWLVWRRDVSDGQVDFMEQLNRTIQRARSEAQRKGAAVTKAGEEPEPNDVVVSIDEQDLAKDIEGIEETLGTLDGQLSLKNATVMVTI